MRIEGATLDETRCSHIRHRLRPQAAHGFFTARGRDATQQLWPPLPLAGLQDRTQCMSKPLCGKPIMGSLNRLDASEWIVIKTNDYLK
ncbi:hypothetical protein LN484_21825 [Xanthomonas vesicatoria]|nr:hypothetical protein [Xanthomonas vesicatoria]